MCLPPFWRALPAPRTQGGFFALGQYTSHMTGYLSQLADNIAILNLWVVTISGIALSAFISKAFDFGDPDQLGPPSRKQRALSLASGHAGRPWCAFSFGGIFSSEIGRLFSLACLCFIMGMQNATITKISGARIRTTHATGMITDIGIEVGRAVYSVLRPRSGVRVDQRSCGSCCSLSSRSWSAGSSGRSAMARWGFFFSLPLAIILLALREPPSILKDKRGR